jgi:tRNA-2-methylthio-N6-dimethylallyladenosine synthase
MSSHPKDATKELIDTIAECEKVTRHFHLPVQSGSSRVLKLMNRHYTREQYLELISYVKEKIPDVALTSDIIVGFPGETYEDFLETLSLIREVRYDSLYTFIYSPRKGTKAAEMPDPVSAEEKGKWFRELLDVQQEVGCNAYNAYIGKTMRVLCEGQGRTRDGCLTGKTPQNVIVDFDGDRSLIGSFVDVEITDALNWALLGKIVNK